MKFYAFWKSGCIVPVCDVEIISYVAHVSLVREY